MNIDHLRTFLEVSACGNFNRAAERLNVTQSTVSARIKALEERLDHQLFIRDKHSVTMTGAGRRFTRHALTVVRAWEHGRQEVGLPEGYEDQIGLGAQVSLWERLILKWIPWMRQQAPTIALRLETDYSSSLMRQLADGLLDVAVLYQPGAVAGVAVEKLLQEKLVMVSSTEIDAADWQRHYVHVDWGYDFQQSHARAFNQLSTAAVSVGLGALGLQYILQNKGAGYFPMRVVSPLIEEGSLQMVPYTPKFDRPAYLVYAESEKERLGTALEGLRQIALLEKEDE